MKRRSWYSGIIFSLDTDLSPLAQDDIRIENKLCHKVFSLCLNGEVLAFSMNCAEEAELAVIVEIAEEFFGAGEISVSGLGERLSDLCLLVRC